VPLVNYVTREITCKIVYYGPGRSGKTTNLRHLHERLPSDRTGQLVSLATEGDRTLFFDFLALDLGVVAGFATRFQLYTVPGQSYYAATRRLVLQGADGVVFVADSRRRQREENLASLQDLHEQLAVHGVEPRAVPLVFQWNKQDLPAELRETPEALDDLLNFRGAPALGADALGGVNVFETMRAACGLVLRRLTGDASAAGGSGADDAAGARSAA
jgi:signal recognition particle receptor subunit beta